MHNVHKASIETSMSGSNKIKRITDSSISTHVHKGHKPGSATDYLYDHNGNMIYDPSRGMSITYNHLNLPLSMVMNSNHKIDYIYDANGNKLREIVTDIGSESYSTTKDYVDGIEYKDSKLEAIAHDNGRWYNVNVNTSISTVSLRHEYSLKDHLGNTRLTFTDKDLDGKIEVSTNPSTNEILSEHHYYSFGLPMMGPWMNGSVDQNTTRYTYNGKEAIEGLDIDLLDYGARFYDPSIGRFTSVDPLAEKYAGTSPYVYTLNNPINLIDPDGREVIAPNKASRQLVLQSVTYMFGKNHGYSFDGNKLVHNGKTPSGMSKGQSLMFSYFNDGLVNSRTKTTVRANQRTSFMETGADAPEMISVKGSSAATTFGTGSFRKMAGTDDFQVAVAFDASNQILVPSETVSGGTNVMTKGGDRSVGADHVLSHEFGHAIVNTIMNEFGGSFNGVDFNAMSKEERSDWAIRFTNTLFSGSKVETGECQHGRNCSTKPSHTLDPLKN